MTVRTLAAHYLTALASGAASSKKLQGQKPTARYLGSTERYLGGFVATYGDRAGSGANSMMSQWPRLQEVRRCCSIGLPGLHPTPQVRADPEDATV